MQGIRRFRRSSRLQAAELARAELSHSKAYGARPSGRRHWTSRRIQKQLRRRELSIQESTWYRRARVSTHFGLFRNDRLEKEGFDAVRLRAAWHHRFGPSADWSHRLHHR